MCGSQGLAWRKVSRSTTNNWFGWKIRAKSRDYFRNRPPLAMVISGNILQVPIIIVWDSFFIQLFPLQSFGRQKCLRLWCALKSPNNKRFSRRSIAPTYVCSSEILRISLKAEQLRRSEQLFLPSSERAFICNDSGHTYPERPIVYIREIKHQLINFFNFFL